MIKFRDTSKTWKVISKKEFRQIVKKWIAIREAEKLMKAVETKED